MSVATNLEEKAPLTQGDEQYNLSFPSFVLAAVTEDAVPTPETAQRRPNPLRLSFLSLTESSCRDANRRRRLVLLQDRLYITFMLKFCCRKLCLGSFLHTSSTTTPLTGTKITAADPGAQKQAEKVLRPSTQGNAVVECYYQGWATVPSRNLSFSKT
ncbi:hypothetical protein ARMGADRAFT_540614 [Armillaria gallica]|uniref:Uncharacterized protein n=1 Tax=Armillaria gallica TaxID=47427 RepID=A0A2H3DDG8_ARMGA|nr:hypothetical protein ARMGADRAFT_540614 [Armillaria gallica]